MTKQEIQKRSAEKQEKILDCLRQEGRPMTVKEVTVIGLPSCLRQSRKEGL